MNNDKGKVMKSIIKILMPLLICTQSIAAPTSSNDLSDQKNKEMLKRIVEEEMRMDPEKMTKILTTLNIEFEQQGNVISFAIQGYNMTIIYDLNADRMRMVTPIVEVKDITQDHIKQAMEANFHTALDARYAISNGIVWAVFIHPLSDLSESLFTSALQQTLFTAATFGKEYSSGILNFPKNNEGSDEEADESDKANEQKNNASEKDKGVTT